MTSVLITGGARGIGAAAVRAFAVRGYRVSFFYVQSEDKAKRLAEETGAKPIRADVAEAEQVRAGFQEAGPVEILVNNAGISHYGLISQISSEEWDRLFAVNVRGVYHCVRAALPDMLRIQRGCIINVASMWGQVGASCEAAYSATKGAVLALTRALAKELGPSGIRVNAVSPGVVDTDMLSGFTAADLEALRQETPLERLGQPEDVAEAMLYLAEADFVTGQVLPVNGGFVI